jgi:phage-related protein
MKSSHYQSVLLPEVEEFIDTLEETEQAKILTHMESIERGDIASVYTKLLKKPIRELIFKRYRFLFFIENQFIYFIHAFVKKTQKTPIEEIRYAERLYKTITTK